MIDFLIYSVRQYLRKSFKFPGLPWGKLFDWVLHFISFLVRLNMNVCMNIKLRSFFTDSNIPMHAARYLAINLAESRGHRWVNFKTFTLLSSVEYLIKHLPWIFMRNEANAKLFITCAAACFELLFGFFFVCFVWIATYLARVLSDSTIRAMPVFTSGNSDFSQRKFRFLFHRMFTVSFLFTLLAFLI